MGILSCFSMKREMSMGVGLGQGEKDMDVILMNEYVNMSL